MSRIILTLLAFSVLALACAGAPTRPTPKSGGVGKGTTAKGKGAISTGKGPTATGKAPATTGKRAITTGTAGRFTARGQGGIGGSITQGRRGRIAGGVSFPAFGLIGDGFGLHVGGFGVPLVEAMYTTTAAGVVPSPGNGALGGTAPPARVAPASGVIFGRAGGGTPAGRALLGFRTLPPVRHETPAVPDDELPPEEGAPPEVPAGVTIRATLNGQPLTLSTAGDTLTGTGKFGANTLRVTGGTMTEGSVTLRGTMSGDEGHTAAFRLVYSPGSGTVRLSFKNPLGGEDISASGKVTAPID